ncbi:hypothetical protein K438DRAFT_1982941 [Mycena galopus ATCC 62051]|nr:hypothetical protein K438DRAFT_1982941 [Mycena galopus ATCC 62051]
MSNSHKPPQQPRKTVVIGGPGAPRTNPRLPSGPPLVTRQASNKGTSTSAPSRAASPGGGTDGGTMETPLPTGGEGESLVDEGADSGDSIPTLQAVSDSSISGTTESRDVEGGPATITFDDIIPYKFPEGAVVYTLSPDVLERVAQLVLALHQVLGGLQSYQNPGRKHCFALDPQWQLLRQLEENFS